MDGALVASFGGVQAELTVHLLPGEPLRSTEGESALKYLPSALMPNEQVLAFSSGFMDGNTWLIALTDKRVLFLDKGFFYGLKQTAIPIKKIQGVSVETGIMFGKIAINDGFAQRKISQVSKASVATFSRKLTELMDESG